MKIDAYPNYKGKTGYRKTPIDWTGLAIKDDGSVYTIPGCNTKRQALRLAQGKIDYWLARANENN
jgi:hypothetical protein